MAAPFCPIAAPVSAALRSMLCCGQADAWIQCGAQPGSFPSSLHAPRSSRSGYRGRQLWIWAWESPKEQLQQQGPHLPPPVRTRDREEVVSLPPDPCDPFPSCSFNSLSTLHMPCMCSLAPQPCSQGVPEFCLILGLKYRGDRCGQIKGRNWPTSSWPPTVAWTQV